MIIIRAVFTVAVLALAGVLVVALSGHLWGRYQHQTAALGFSGITKNWCRGLTLRDFIHGCRLIAVVGIEIRFYSTTTPQIPVIHMQARSSKTEIPAGEDAATLTISPEKVCFIIIKAREFDAKDEVTDPEFKIKSFG